MAFKTLKRRRRKKNLSALNILKKRYARGEIEKQEYEERRRELKD